MVRVLIVSDIRLYREGLADMLSCDGRVEVGRTTRSVTEALDHMERFGRGVVLLDMGMPDSVAAMRAIRAAGCPVRVVALGISETRDAVVGCAEAGAQGYLCRDSSLEDLVAAVAAADAGELSCPPRIAAALMQSVARLAARVDREDEVRLTRREMEIAELLDAGLANRDIAHHLHIAVSTVKVHVHNILDKLGARRRGEAAAKLRRLGLLCAQRERA